MNETNFSLINEALPGAPHTSVPRSSVVIHYFSCIHCFMIMDINIYILDRSINRCIGINYYEETTVFDDLNSNKWRTKLQ